MLDRDFIECGEGWRPLVETFYSLTDRDTEYNKTAPVVVKQIKEKFGELRIYYSGGDERTDGYAQFASMMSQQICEECGCPASLRSRKGWYRTLCEEHIA